MFLALAAVVFAAVYLARRAWRTWRPTAAGCGGGCGCAKAPATDTGLIPSETLRVKRRME
jgi:hypothetical protein